MLIGPKLLLACLQHHGGLHHVLLALVLVEAAPQHAGVKAVLVSVRARWWRGMNMWGEKKSVLNKGQ